MKTVILAGGSGSRLEPLTLDRSAALLPVANRPLIEHLLEHLIRHGVSEAVLALHHCPYPLEAHLGDGTPWGLRLGYALERRPLGTAGALRPIAGRWPEPFLVAFATAVTTVDIEKVLAAHQIRGAALTLVLAPADGPGELGVDDEGGVVPPETPGAARGIFAGLAVVEPQVLGFIPAGTPSDLVADLVPRLLAVGLPVHAHVTTEPTLVVRAAADLAIANRRALAGELPGLVLPGFETRPGIRLSRGAAVHREARLIPPVLVGANAVIGRGATVEATVVGDDVMVGPRSTVRHSVLFSRTYVGRGLGLDGALVDRDRVRRAAAGSWTTVRDPRLLGDTRAPFRARPASLGGRLIAAALLAVSAPVWIPVLTALALETRGRPLRGRRVIGARGGEAPLWRVAVRGPVGRLVRRLGLVRGPQLWSVARGDLRWVGVSARSSREWEAQAAGAELPPAPPGLVTLADLGPAPLRGRDRLALDRLYVATRSRRGDLRMLASALRAAGRRARALPRRGVVR
jgi:NDP-sugar pyrophosphorylase family protein